MNGRRSRLRRREKRLHAEGIADGTIKPTRGEELQLLRVTRDRLLAEQHQEFVARLSQLHADYGDAKATIWAEYHAAAGTENEMTKAAKRAAKNLLERDPSKLVVAPGDLDLGRVAKELAAATGRQAVV